MSLKVVSSKFASEIDQELMGPAVGFTLQQLMELAGFSVAQSIQREYPLSSENRQKRQVFIIVGPGNNGGDGLVCARHLKLFGYDPVVYYPIRSKRTEFYGQLVNQLKFFQVPILSEDQQNVKWVEYLDPQKTLCIVDAIFGFSFKPPIREPFGSIISELHKLESKIPIVSVDIPTGWDVDEGPISEPHITPSVLVSLTVPKPCSKFINQGKTAHYVGGRFIPPEFAAKYGFEPFAYPETDQVLKL